MTIHIEKPEILASDNIEPSKSYVLAASAGTGKTYALEHLVVDRVVDQGIDLEDILVVTFTRRATAEMKSRIRALFEEILQKWAERESNEDGGIPDCAWEIGPDEVDRVHEALDEFDSASISTIHSFCQDVLSDYAFSCGELFTAERAEAGELYEESFYELVREKFAAAPEYRPILRKTLELGVGLDDLAGQIEELISRNARVVPDEIDGTPLEELDARDLDEEWKAATICWRLFRSDVERRVEKRKAEEGLTTYDDLLEQVNLHLDNGLREVLRERFEVVLVDEFQDTDPVQWDIFRSTFLESNDHELFVIGDEKQCIYRFRGADIHNYRQVVGSSRFDDQLDLDCNYRSTDELLAAYNELFSAEYFDETDYQPVDAPEDEQLKTRRNYDEVIGSSPVEFYQLVKDPDRDGRDLSKSKAQPAFVAWTADKIETLLDDDTPWRFDGETRLRPGDIYVLTRTNAEAKEVGEALTDRGIPYAFYRKPGLFETDEALEVLRLLRAIARPSDRSLRRKAFLTPFFSIRLDELLDYDGDVADEHEATPRKRLEEWHDLAVRREFSQLFDAIMRQSGVVRRQLLSTDSERRLTNYHHLFDWLLGEAATGNLGIEQLADRLYRFREGDISGDEEEGMDLQRLETDKSAVQVMTIYKAKGLSAEVVFVCGGFSKLDHEHGKRNPKICQGATDDAGYPVGFHADAEPTLDDDVWDSFCRESVEDARRLFYVAVTRAVSKVYLPYITEEDATRWRTSAELQIVTDVRDRLRGTDGFSTTTFTRYDVDTGPRVPRLVESGDVLDDNDDVRRLAGATAPEGPGSRSFYDLRNNRRRITTSYSQLADHGGDRGDAVEPEEPVGTPLPRRIEAGNVLHEILEHLDYQSVTGFDESAAWRDAGGASQALIDETLDEYGFDPDEFGDYTADIIYQALQTELRTDDGRLRPLAKTDRTAREVSFLLPLPDRNTDSPVSTPPEDVRVEHGYFTGEVDLMFESDSRVYFADWKSDTRIGGPEYTREVLRDHVQSEYREQIAVYTVATIRMLGIESRADYEERFGGVFYLFVRGMDAERDRGQFFERLDWPEVERLCEELSTKQPQYAVETWKQTARSDR